jgi:hypothetical protein
MFCLFGLCHLCTGRIRVLDIAGHSRDEVCEHPHPNKPAPADHRSEAGTPMRVTPTCHPNRPYGGHGWCQRCYHRRWREGEYGARANRGSRPVIDLDLGHAMQYGYHRPPVRVVEGPPALLDAWVSGPKLAAAVTAVLADGPQSTVELAEALGFTQERQYRLWYALRRMAGRGEVRRASACAPGRPTTWESTSGRAAA